MTMIIDGSSGATFPNSTVQASAGKVLQVVSATYSTQVSTSSDSFTDTGLTATITPKFATSKILILVDQNSVGKDTSNTGVNIILQRNGSNISGRFGFVAGYTNSTATNNIGSSSINYLDSPATTSAVVYKTQFSSNSPLASAIVQQFGAMSTITLMEIAV